MASRTTETLPIRPGRIQNDGQAFASEMVWRIPREGVMHQLRDHSLAVVSQHVREATGHAPVRAEVAGPPLAPIEKYAELLGARVSLCADRNALVYTREAWDAPVARRDALLQRTLRRHAELLLDRSSRTAKEDVAERVRAALLQHGWVGCRPWKSPQRFRVDQSTNRQ